MTKKEIFEAYEKVKDNADCIILSIHMPTGETETISNPNVAEKMKYIDKTYNDELVHSNCKDIYIENVVFCTPNDKNTFGFGEAIIILKEGGIVTRKYWNDKRMYLRYLEPVGGTPYIGMGTVRNKYIQWIASQKDMLAEDWYEITLNQTNELIE